jgi:hypothetical protein
MREKHAESNREHSRTKKETEPKERSIEHAKKKNMHQKKGKRGEQLTETGKAWRTTVTHRQERGGERGDCLPMI